jgi:hypothetical protein
MAIIKAFTGGEFRKLKVNLIETTSLCEMNRSLGGCQAAGK